MMQLLKDERFKVFLMAVFIFLLGALSGYGIFKSVKRSEPHHPVQVNVLYYKKLRILTEIKTNLDIYNLCVKKLAELQAKAHDPQDKVSARRFSLGCYRYPLIVDKHLNEAVIFFNLNDNEQRLVQKIMHRPDFKVLDQNTQQLVRQVYQIIDKKMANEKP